MGKKVFIRYGGKPDYTSKGVVYSENVYDRSVLYDLDNERDRRNLQQRTIELLVEGYACRLYSVENIANDVFEDYEGME